MTKVIKDYPPNIDQIAEVLPRAKTDRGVIFAYSPDIYSPHDETVSPELVAHEECHIRQQDGDPIGWWQRYLEESDFRFEQELEAHIVEAKFVYDASGKTRNDRRLISKHIARKVCSPLYGVRRDSKKISKLVMEELK